MDGVPNGILRPGGCALGAEPCAALIVKVAARL